MPEPPGPRRGSAARRADACRRRHRGGAAAPTAAVAERAAGPGEAAPRDQRRAAARRRRAARCADVCPRRRPRREIHSWLMDMDGVLVHEEQRDPRRAASSSPGCSARRLPFPRPDQQLDATRAATSPRGCGPQRARRARGLASAPARSRPRRSSSLSVPGGTAFVIGEAGLTTALHEAGYTMTEREPDYVVLGETRDVLLRALSPWRSGSSRRGARFIADEPRHRPARAPVGPLPATGSVAALITPGGRRRARTTSASPTR